MIDEGRGGEGRGTANSSVRPEYIIPRNFYSATVT